MIGQTVSHYRIVDLLGAGGMGVVYKAEDSRLRRFVALKFLPPELTLDGEAKERFVHEAQAASALDHPNICTIHEIDETSDGRLFIAMAYYPGETLKQRLARGPLAAPEALTIAAQIALAVAAAHDAGIVHRDIKPANVMLTAAGEVKLLDFGLAKLPQSAMPTRSAVGAVGTIAYMAPEQISGVADARTDVWALGVVLYEMLAGALPFHGENDAAVLNAILHGSPQPLAERRSDIGDVLPAIVDRALQKVPAARYASAHHFLDELSRVEPALRGQSPIGLRVRSARSRARATWRTGAVVALAAIIVTIVAAIGLSMYRTRAVRRVTETLLPEIRRLIADDNYVKALIITADAERVLGDSPELASLIPQMSIARPVRTNPAGASVWIRDPALRSEWMLLGTTPIESARVPPGIVRWRIERAGYQTEEVIRAGMPRSQPAPGLPEMVDLTPMGSVPDGMVKIPAGNLTLPLTGYNYSVSIPAGEYLIDRNEVTNREFKDFVDAGGYQKRRYWTHPFVRSGRTIPWEIAVAEFRDQTGRAGPSTWEVGAYPKGQEEYPVSGVSWYEAAAYAEFKGRSLPTVYHWLRAAGTSASVQITPRSNFSGRVVAAGQTAAVSPFGLHDTAGNVKEWCFNELERGGTRYILGGGAGDPEYMFFFADARSPFDRSPLNGFRTVKYLKPDSIPDETTHPIVNRARNYDNAKPVSDEVFRAYTGLHAYDPTPLAASIDLVDDSSPAWRRERVSFAATYGKERVAAHVFLPRTGRPPYQAVIYWPGSGTIQPRSSEPPLQLNVIDWLVLGGRAVIYPVYYGTYERQTERHSGWPAPTREYSEWVMKQIADARRTVDYVQSRADLRHDGIGYLGFSWGGTMGSIVLALDRRFQAAVFLSAGFSTNEPPPEVDPLNFAPRVSIPVLMINGNQDFIVGVDSEQKAMFRFLGSPPDRKRHVVLPAGHAVIFDKRSDVIREALDWFDRYLGAAR